MKGLFIPGITAEMFRNGCLESIEALMSEGKIFDIELERCWHGWICQSLMRRKEMSDFAKDTNVPTNDCISRQEAIDALAKFVPYSIYDESEKSYMNGLTDAYNLICQLPSAEQWTPVSEGLPKLKEKHYVSGWVLCSDNEERICFGRVEENVFGEMLWNCERDGVSGKVLAWMPLPEPYEGGDAE